MSKKNLGAKPYIYPLPVLIVSTYDENGAADAMNVAYGGILNSNRLQINIGVRHKTSDNIKIKKEFCVGIADRKHLKEADYLGLVSGHDEADKIEKAHLHITKSTIVDAPIIDELPITLECRVEEINQYDQTLRIVAEIINVCAEESILTEDEKVDVKKLDAITYDPSNKYYLSLGDIVGNAFADGNSLKVSE